MAQQHIGPTVLVYSSQLFRDCLSAILRDAGLCDVTTVELDELKPDACPEAETMIVELNNGVSRWRRAMEIVTKRSAQPNRMLVLAASLQDDELLVLACRRIAASDVSQLREILGAWCGTENV